MPVKCSKHGNKPRFCNSCLSEAQHVATRVADQYNERRLPGWLWTLAGFVAGGVFVLLVSALR